MSDIFNAAPGGMTAFAAANEAASATIAAAGAADSAAMLNAAAAAVGPIGATYLAAYAPAQSNNVAATLIVSAVHDGIGIATTDSTSAVVATDGS